ncbi:Aldo/keto reductase [Ramaria rubella]|nr:Aldo/keto reductase [Ramaria rubella]
MPEVVKQEFDKKDMIFRRLGPSGLRVPVFSLGGWLTLGGSVTGDPVKEIIKAAFDAGINMFDTAEAYAAGQSELEMGRVIKELGYRRSDLVITTKLFWGVRSQPNSQGLSRKHIIEGTQESLQRLGMDYVDVIFAHRCDITVPMEEIVRAFNYVIEKGYAFYWGTSEWTAQQIQEAFHIADKLHLIPPIAEQCQHQCVHLYIIPHAKRSLIFDSLLHRDRPELEYAPLYRNYGYKTTVFSALAGGLLTGKYNDGVPAGSRLDYHKDQDQFKRVIQEYETEAGKAKIAKVKKLTEFAEKELGTTVTALSLAWVAVQPSTSTVILGASKPEQVTENLKALQVLPKLTPEVLQKIDEIMGTKPAREAEYRQRL